jgi:hypothetical protein
METPGFERKIRTHDEVHTTCLQTEVHDPQEWPPQKPQPALALFA